LAVRVRTKIVDVIRQETTRIGGQEFIMPTMRPAGTSTCCWTTGRPGVKFNDADLIGVPVRVTVGTRGLSAGAVEIKERVSGDLASVALDEAAGHIVSLVQRTTV
jgi:prolyl-tRNA synthetase